MANNPQYMGGSGPPLRPMVGSMAPMQNIPPPMPPQFRPVAPMHPPQHFTPSQQYQPLGHGMPPMNIGMPPSQSHQMQFAQPIQQAPVRPLPPGPPPPLMSQPIPMQVPNVALNRPMSSGLPQPGQDMQAQSSFPPSSGGVPVQLPPVYAPNSFTTAQFQPVSQINLQSNSTPGPPPMASANQGAALFTPVHQTAQPSPSVSNNKAADSQPTPAEQPSSDWLEHMKNGRRYYYNKKTRQSTWEKPSELMSPIERADATTDWKEFTSLDGRKYFYNKLTKQSKWLIPEELKLAREQAEKASCTKEVSEDARALSSTPLSDIKTPSNAENPVANSTPNKVTPEAVPYTPPPSSSPALANLPHHNPGTQANAAEVQPPSVNSPAVSGNVDANAASTKTLAVPMSSSNALSAQQAADSSQNVGEKDTEDAKPSTSISGKNTSALDDKPVERETPAYATKQEAKDAFKALLESVNVESDWTWEQTMRLIINDKRYGALKSLGERKQTFNEYLSHKKKQEAEERRARNKKAKEDFRKMLEECNELTSSTRWGKAVNMFGNDERFNAIERARDREDMFEEYLIELEEKEQAKAEEDHLRYILEYRKFLESCDFIKGNSQWRKVKDRLEVDERCSRLETMDRLKYFQEYVGDLEKEEEEQRRLQKEEIRKVERKNRDEFRKLMDAHISDGTLTAKTLWREYHSKVKDIPAYQAVASNSSGSTPKELFEDVAEELSKKYEEARSLIKDTVKSEKVCLVQPKSEIDLEFEMNKLSTPWGFMSAILLGITTFGTIAITSGFFVKPGATVDDYVADVVPLFAGFLTILGVSEIATRLAANRYGVKLSPSFLVPSNWTGCLGVMNNYESLLPNKKALFDIPVARTASAYLTSLGLAVAAFISDGSFNGGDNALFVRPQFFENNPLFSFIQYVIGPYADDLGNVLPNAVEGVGVPVDPLAFAGLLGMVVTSLNLLPCGRLEGGRIAQAMFGRSTATLLSFATSLLLGIGGLSGSVLCLAWGLFAAFFRGGEEIPATDEITPLGEDRYAWGVVLFLVCFLTLFPNGGGTFSSSFFSAPFFRGDPL